ncbi:hypothetical protein ILUMI_08515 [Ignelater luminosus]|uniref:Uncharacterized protein n=1 Tax=Ignelater luminosus TaxID=2038154 RepID=A0A8K0D6Q5_IGNLU|nr:hypothetical protein ILUMI_08515 [Ignelater luminosus]
MERGKPSTPTVYRCHGVLHILEEGKGLHALLLHAAWASRYNERNLVYNMEELIQYIRQGQNDYYNSVKEIKYENEMLKQKTKELHAKFEMLEKEEVKNNTDGIIGNDTAMKVGTWNVQGIMGKEEEPYEKQDTFPCSGVEYENRAQAGVGAISSKTIKAGLKRWEYILERILRIDKRLRRYYNNERNHEIGSDLCFVETIFKKRQNATIKGDDQDANKIHQSVRVYKLSQEEVKLDYQQRLENKFNNLRWNDISELEELWVLFRNNILEAAKETCGVTR